MRRPGPGSRATRRETERGSSPPAMRTELLPLYKSARALPGSPQAEAEVKLQPQWGILWELLEALGVPVLGHDDQEAEDVIGTLAARATSPVAIVSGDRDLFQLVRDPDVWVLYPRRGVSDPPTLATSKNVRLGGYARYMSAMQPPPDGAGFAYEVGQSALGE